MPLDVAAEVLSNTRLSSDYNVLVLAAPEIAAAAAPGQFVMLKTGDRLEPLLRRPFSVFEILKRDGAHHRTVGAEQAHRSVHATCCSTPGRAIACSASARSAARSFRLSPPDEAWLVAGGVGLAPFATLADALRARGTP